MDAVNLPISQTYLIGILGSTYALATHNHVITDVSGLDAALAGKQATLVSGVNIKTVGGVSVLGSGNIVVGGGSFASLTGAPSDNASLASSLNSKLNLSGGTLTGALNFPGTGILDSPGTNIARLFSSANIWIQANAGTISLLSSGSTAVTINAGATTFENATTPNTNATVQIRGRSTQNAELLRLDVFNTTVGDALSVVNVTTPLASITKLGQGVFNGGVDITGGFFRPPPITFGALPSASANGGAWYRLTDRSQKVVYSDSTNWLWVHDNTIAS